MYLSIYIYIYIAGIYCVRVCVCITASQRREGMGNHREGMGQGSNHMAHMASSACLREERRGGEKRKVKNGE